MTVIERGLARMQSEGGITAEAASGLRAEALARVSESRFFGFMAYISMIAAKPG